MRESILIVDDEKEICDLLRDALTKERFEVETALDGRQGLGLLEENLFDLVITDIKMKGMDGLEFLSRVKEFNPEIPVIMITAFGSIDIAIDAMKKGASEFVTKPFKLNELLMQVEKTLEKKRVLAENKRLRMEVQKKYEFSNIIGKSKAMQEVFRLIELVAGSMSNVLIYGDSGTGKELVARAIHYNCSRANGPFIPINCSAIPEGLLESELFGHVKGAFTGAHTTRRGLFLEATGGTLFLDEIGDLGFGIQAKLLRVLQDKLVRPVGSNKSYQVNTRIISATHRDLKAAVKDGTFREDLYYRLSVIPIYIPSLNKRIEDIPILVKHFLEKTARQMNQPLKRISPAAMDLLMKYHWEGNVRELENIIERIVVLTAKESITPDDLPSSIVDSEKLNTFIHSEELPTLEELEKEYIVHVLKKTNGNKDKAAKLLGINRRTLYRKKERYSL